MTPTPESEPCPDCLGGGRGEHDDPCPDCMGTGLKIVPEHVRAFFEEAKARAAAAEREACAVIFDAAADNIRARAFFEEAKAKVAAAEREACAAILDAAADNIRARGES